MDKLKPCPFCGNMPISEGDHGRGPCDHTSWSIFCMGGERFADAHKIGFDDCFVEPEVIADTEAKAIAAWNRRPPEATK